MAEEQLGLAHSLASFAARRSPDAPPRELLPPGLQPRAATAHPWAGPGNPTPGRGRAPTRHGVSPRTGPLAATPSPGTELYPHGCGLGGLGHVPDPSERGRLDRERCRNMACPSTDPTGLSPGVWPGASGVRAWRSWLGTLREDSGFAVNTDFQGLRLSRTPFWKYVRKSETCLTQLPEIASKQKGRRLE